MRHQRMESVVLLNESGEMTGTADKHAVHTATTPLHLAFSCYLVDTDGRLLLTRRADSKRTWPGVWTNSCCGHPRPGEEIADSVVRRVHDELRMRIGQVRLVLPEFRYRAEMHGVVENEMCPVFCATALTAPRPNADEVSAVQWVPWEAFRRRALERPQTLSPWCVEQLHELDRLGTSPSDWPDAAPDTLPAAARGLRRPAGRSGKER